MFPIFIPHSSPLPVPSRLSALKRTDRWVMEGSLVMCLKDTQEEFGLPIIPAPSPEEKMELYQLPKTCSVIEKDIGKRNGPWRAEKPQAVVLCEEPVHSLPLHQVFIKCLFFWVFHLFSISIEFLDLFLLIYIAWVLMLLKTLIKENE